VTVTHVSGLFCYLSLRPVNLGRTPTGPPRAPAMFEKGAQFFDADLRPSGLTLPPDSLVQQFNRVALAQRALHQDSPIDTGHTIVGFRNLP
jgi:hypothetical protein